MTRCVLSEPRLWELQAQQAWPPAQRLGASVASLGTVRSTAGASSQTPERQVEATTWRPEQRVPPACHCTPEPPTFSQGHPRVWLITGALQGVSPWHQIRGPVEESSGCIFWRTREEEQQGALPPPSLPKAAPGFPGGAPLENRGSERTLQWGPGLVHHSFGVPRSFGGDKIGRTKGHISCLRQPGGSKCPVGGHVGPLTPAGHHTCPLLKTHQVPTCFQF